MRRLFDLVSCLAGLAVLLPLLAAIALLIVLEDGRPVFFLQKRMGRTGVPFLIWKFRTMRVNSQGSAITAAGDPRVTRVGRCLRKLKLDELPQLFNVVKGDMGLVGPRPEVPKYVDLEDPVWTAVLRVRPGITDVATLIYRDEEAVLGLSEDPDACYRQRVLPSKLQLNLAYLQAKSFGRDLKLILLTILYSVFPAGFDRKRVAGILDMGAEIHDADFVYSLPRSIRR